MIPLNILNIPSPVRNQNCGLFFRQAALCYNLLLDCGGVLVSIYLHSSKEGSLSRSDHRSDSVSSVSFERSWKTTTAYVAKKLFEESIEEVPDIL